MKLAAELARPDTGKTLYLLDEPTTGLHFDDIRKLLDVLHRLVDLGNTVVVIEHNLDVIKTADWVIDLGPEAGVGGGELVAEGTPEEIAEHPRSHTGEVPQGPARRRPLRRAARSSTPRPPPARRIEAAKAATAQRRGPAEKAATEGQGQGKRKAEAGGRVSGSPRPPGRSTAASGIPGTASPATAARRAGTAGSSSRSSIASRRWPPAASPRPTGPSAGVVRIDGLDKETKLSFPFFHATTSGEWVVTLRFFVPRNTFRANAGEGLLELVPFHESPTPVLSDAPRVKIETTSARIQEIIITGHSAADFETPGFEAFLAKAVAAYPGPGKTGKLKKASEL